MASEVVKWGAIGLAAYYVYTHFIQLPVATTAGAATGTPNTVPVGVSTPVGSSVPVQTYYPPTTGGGVTQPAQLIPVPTGGGGSNAQPAMTQPTEQAQLIALNGGDSATMDVWNYYLSQIRGTPADPQNIDLFEGGEAGRQTPYTSSQFYAARAAHGISGLGRLGAMNQLYRRGAYR